MRKYQIVKIFCNTKNAFGRIFDGNFFINTVGNGKNGAGSAGKQFFVPFFRAFRDKDPFERNARVERFGEQLVPFKAEKAAFLTVFAVCKLCRFRDHRICT